MQSRDYTGNCWIHPPQCPHTRARVAGSSAEGKVRIRYLQSSTYLGGKYEKNWSMQVQTQTEPPLYPSLWFREIPFSASPVIKKKQATTAWWSELWTSIPGWSSRFIFLFDLFSFSNTKHPLPVKWMKSLGTANEITQEHEAPSDVMVSTIYSQVWSTSIRLSQ